MTSGESDGGDLVVRRALLDDASGINAIYNRYILESPATFEVEPIDLPARQKWLERLSQSPRTPVVVAEQGEDLAGFANAAPFDARPAYETSVKVSVFLREKVRGRGVGARLYEELFSTLEGVDVHRAYALIVSPNAGSVRLHERFGFRHVSTLSEVGRKFGRYYDVMWFEKRF